ncbi:MAG: DNA-binding response regulator [Calditrichaeota bacterium]|nr:MAG: DNA-binding response regulator [Calditrichota bacterium]
MAKSERVLIIEDDRDIADLVEIHLHDLGYTLDRAEDGFSGLRKFENNEYALIILDLMLPGMDGLEVCKRIRAENQYTPILMLTAKSEELDKVLGLELGADDYLTKPFSIRELIARIKAIFRRLQADEKQASHDYQKERLQYGELTIDLIKRKVVLGGKPIELTAKEFDLLALFATHPGRAYNRQELLDLVWGYQFSGYDHTVNSHINRLRSKIEQNPAKPRFIKTVWGVGYRFVEPEELEA